MVRNTDLTNIHKKVLGSGDRRKDKHTRTRELRPKSNLLAYVEMPPFSSGLLANGSEFLRELCDLRQAT